MSDFFDNDPLPDVMVDTETLGIRPNAPIIAIGAVAFDSRKLALGERFYAVIDLASSVALGSVIDPGTVLWWMEQSDDARRAITRKGNPAVDVLRVFAQWLDENTLDTKGRRMWACGPDFDLVLLGEHYIKAGIETPWKFWNHRCYRTLKALYPNVEQDERVGKHNALDDAVHQVEHMFKIRRTLRGNKDQ